MDLKKGEDYKNLKTTVQIGILDFDLWKSGKNPFYQVYELWDTEHDRVFTNKMKLCVLSLRQAEKAEVGLVRLGKSVDCRNLGRTTGIVREK